MLADGALGNAKHFGDFLDGHATKESKLDDLGPLLVDLGQGVQCFIQRQDVFIALRAECNVVSQGNSLAIATSFLCSLLPRAVKQEGREGARGLVMNMTRRRSATADLRRSSAVVGLPLIALRNVSKSRTSTRANAPPDARRVMAQ